MSDTNTISIDNPILDVDNIRSDFPLLSKEIEGKPLIYLDNGATTHKPTQVIERVKNSSGDVWLRSSGG